MKKMDDGMLKYAMKTNNRSGDDSMLNYVYSMESITFHTLKNLFHKFSREKEHGSGDDNDD